MLIFHKSREFICLVCFNYFVLAVDFSTSPTCEAIAFNEVSTLHVWITISSLANKDPNNNKALLFRQVELNWINAPLEDENDYIGLYLDSVPGADNTLPVSVHRLNGQTSGQIITDYYLPQLDFLNDTLALRAPRESSSPAEWASYKMLADEEQAAGAGLMQQWFHHRASHRQPADERLKSGLGRTKLADECVGYCLAYHSKNKMLAKNCLKTSPNWMLDSFHHIGTRSLPSLMIPGSHNSATYSKQLDKSVLNMINKYQLNQDERIFNQLVYGLRHLDLRVGYSKVKQRAEKFWIYHDIFRTEVSVNEVLEEVKLFLELTSHEIIIMDFHRFTVGFQNEPATIQRERHSKLIDLIQKHLGQYVVPSYLGQHAPLNEYIGMGKRLLVGYANRGAILSAGGGQAQSADSAAQQYSGLMKSGAKLQHQVRDSDANKQDQEEANAQADAKASARSAAQAAASHSDEIDNQRAVGGRLFNKLKSLKLVSNSFSKRSIERGQQPQNALHSLRLSATINEDDSTAPVDVTRAALFFSPVRHLWPNKDTLEGLAQYMNETTCRKYFGELRSMMAELTPTVFGAIADKYDGNRKLAQLVNRQVSDWIRDRWLHCINIVATDFFLGNNLIRLSIYANQMRVAHQNIDLNLNDDQCKSFKKVEHLLDKSKIPIQFAFAHQQQAPQLAQFHPLAPPSFEFAANPMQSAPRADDVITHTSSDGNQILLKPLAASHNTQLMARERRDSIVDNVSDGFTNLISSFKRLLSL